jgi:hypothetical protein
MPGCIASRKRTEVVQDQAGAKLAAFLIFLPRVSRGSTIGSTVSSGASIWSTASEHPP